MAALGCNTVILTYRRLADLPILKFTSRSLIPRAVAVVEGPRVEAEGRGRDEVLGREQRPGKTTQSVHCTTTGPCRLPVNSSHGQLVTRSTRHMVSSSQVNSSPSRLVTQSTRHKEAVNSSQANKQTNIKAVLPQQYNYR